MKNITNKKKAHQSPSNKTRWAYWMQAIEPTSETLNKAFPGYHPQWVQKSQQLQNSPENFILLRQAIGISREQCAAYLHVSLRTITRWESGAAPVPFANFELLRLILDSVPFKLSHPEWDGWFISSNGSLNSPDVGGNGFTPEMLVLSTITRNEAALLRNDVARLQSQLEEAALENRAIRGMLLDKGITDEVAEMQEKINALMARINTARIIPFPTIEGEQPQEKVA